jgi:hypothetical protein
MRIIRGLELFRLDRRGKRLTLASWHSPHSLTWRWVLDLSWGWRPRLHAGHWGNPKGSGSWSVWLAFIGLAYRWQRPMWFRNLYMRMRDEQDIRNGTMWVSEGHPLHHLMPSPPPPKPTASGTTTVQ